MSRQTFLATGILVAAMAATGPEGGGGRSGGPRLLKRGREVVLLREPDELLHRLAVLEQDHRRDRADPELGADLAVAVGVDLADLRPAGELLGDLVDRGRQHPARLAPLRPEVHEDRNVGLHDFGLEVRVGEFAHVRVSHWVLLRERGEGF